MERQKKPIFRHELKYLISERERDILLPRLKEFTKADSHAKNGSYFIRSLYFDDIARSAYVDKEAGVSSRRKYRIRIYNLSDDFISLECKQKEGSYIRKISARLTPSELNDILNGNYYFLLSRKEEVCSQFAVELLSNGLRPEVIVDYDRRPFIMDAGTVRVTFDEHVRSGFMKWDIFDGTIPVYETLEPGKLIMEVKYTEFLPQIMRDILPLNAAEQVAASKYVMCCDAMKELRGVI